MKHLFTAFLITLLCVCTKAQVPAKFSFQAVIRSANGTLLSNGNASVRISILQGSAAGNTVFSETHSAATNGNGLASLQVGGGTNVLGSIASIDWANGPYFIKTEVDPLNGNNFTLSNETQLLSVPYALFAGNGGTPGPQGPAGAQGPQGIPGPTGPSGSFPAGTNAGEMLYWNGTTWTAIAPGTSGLSLNICNGVPTWGPCPGSIAAITTTAASSITSTSATVGGNVLSAGGLTVTQRGVCYATTPLPTTANTVVTSGSGTGSFSTNLTGLTANTTYYVRAFATNSAGTSYGNEISFAPIQTIAIGQTYNGGIIFYVDNTGQHGLISATQDLGIGSPWGCEGTSINGTSLVVGTGLFNTEAIVVGCSATNTAAYLTYNLDYNGYTDWYLPSRDELSLMYTNLYQAGLGSFNLATYWSSTEANNSTAWIKSFVTGNNSSNFKNTATYRVRPIRAF